MNGQTPVVALSHPPGSATARHAPNSEPEHATANATGSIKALALKALQGVAVRQERDAPTTHHARGVACSRPLMRQHENLPWPMPESGQIDTSTTAGRYACLWAIAAVYRAGLREDAGGRLTLDYPATMPLEAVQAAQEGLAELTGYIVGRLKTVAVGRG